MACEPLSVLILSTCLIAFWPCVLPLCFAVPILPYPMYYTKNGTQEIRDSTELNDKFKVSVEKKKKPESPHEKNVTEVREVKEAKEAKEAKETKEAKEAKEVEEDKETKEAKEQASGEQIRTSKGVPLEAPFGIRIRTKRNTSKAKYSSDDDYDSEEECCTPTNCKDMYVGRDLRDEECCSPINCKDKNVGRELRDIDLECDLCGRYKANLYYDSDDDYESETEIDEIIVRPRRKAKMVNKKTKTNNVTKKGSGDRCNCSHRRFGRNLKREDQLYCLTSRNFVH